MEIDKKYLLIHLAALIAVPLLTFTVTFVCLALAPQSDHPGMAMGVVIFPAMSVIGLFFIFLLETLWLSVKGARAKRNSVAIVATVCGGITILFFI